MKKIFFIGDVALDEYYQADYFPKIKEKIIVHTLPAQMGGSIANAACVFQSMGNSPYFLTALNSGDITQRLLKNLNESGINTDYMVFDDSIPDSKCIIILAENEHTVFIPTLALQEIMIDEKTLAELCGCDYLYTNFIEIAPLKCGNRNAADILKLLKENGVKVWCDLDWAEYIEGEESFFPYIHTAFLNEQGAEALSERYGAEWKEKFFDAGVSIIVLTEADKGCSIYLNGEEPVKVDGIKVEVTDVTGAGDTFGSAFMHAVMRSSDMRLCAEFANFAAARAVTGMGARFGAVCGDDLKEFIAEHGGDVKKYEVFLKNCVKDI